MAKQTIDEKLRELEKQVFEQTNEKMDSYSLSMVRALLIANTELVDSNAMVSHLLEKNIKPVNNYYDNLSPSAAFMLKWGWGIYTLLISSIIAAAIFITKPAHLADEQKFVFDKIQIVEGKGYFIPESEFENYKEKGKESGILIPLPLSEE